MDKDRLIHVDELQKHFTNFEDNRGEPSTTVPSITIEWLDEQIRGYSSRLQSTELKALILVKQLWEKSQEDESYEYDKKA